MPPIASTGKRPLAKDDPRHGTLGGYTNHACRCGRCNEAAKAYRKEWYERDNRHGRKPRAEYLAEAKSHGLTRYRKGCRCDICRAASAAQKRRQRANNAEHYQSYWRERYRGSV